MSAPEQSDGESPVCQYHLQALMQIFLRRLPLLRSNLVLKRMRNGSDMIRFDKIDKILPWPSRRLGEPRAQRPVNSWLQIGKYVLSYLRCRRYSRTSPVEKVLDAEFSKMSSHFHVVLSRTLFLRNAWQRRLRTCASCIVLDSQGSEATRR